jgi:hypothetical protein
MNKVHFELLAVDIRGASVIQSDTNLLHSFLANGQLWRTPSLQENRRITDRTIILEVKSVTPDENSQEGFSKGFFVRTEGDYSELEPLRKPITQYLKSQNFDSIYVLLDQVSERIACELYPLIYQVENLLRQYLIKFMVMRLGPNWWDATATSEWSQKVRQRRYNEIDFSEYIDNKAYLIDFGDLGKMIYAQSSGFTSKEDILKRINEVEETPEAIRVLKEQLQSNYQKFFRESFKDKAFQEKWENLEKLRHKVAHNNLFTASDLAEGKELAIQLISIMQEADTHAEQVVLEVEEKKAIQDSIIAQGYAWNVITEEKFLSELRGAEDYFSEASGFVGLGHFVKTYLGNMGYDYKSSYDMASRLEAKGMVEIYRVDNPYGELPVHAIRIVPSQIS